MEASADGIASALSDLMALSYVNPLMSNFSLPLQILIGKILSIALLIWLVMPWVTQVFGFWLNPKRKSWRLEAFGMSALAISIVAFVVFFRILASVHR